MPFDLFGGQAALELDTDDIAYRSGACINARVRIDATEPLTIQEARAELVYTNRYQYRTSSGRSGSRISNAADEEVVDRAQLLPAGTLQPRNVSEHRAVLAVPPLAPPTAEGEITQIDWRVRAILAVRLRPDTGVEVPITVLSPPEAYAAWAESTATSNTDDCGMAYELSSRHLRTGERVNGALMATPRVDFDVTEIRIELVCREEVPRARGNVVERVESSAILADAGRFEVGRSPRFPFELFVPSNACPCLETAQSTIHWSLRAVLSRSLRSDFRLVQLLNVYTAARTP